MRPPNGGQDERPPLRILIVAANPQQQQRLVAAIAAAPDLRVLAARFTVSAAVSQIGTGHAPAVALVDLDACDLNGEASIAALLVQFPSAQVVLLGPDPDPGLVIRALRAGADGYLARDITPDALVRALRALERGESLLPRGMVRLLVQVLRHGRPFDAAFRASLSARERDVLAEIVAGSTNLDIARRLCMGEATVKTHVSNILRKTQLRSRFQLQHGAGSATVRRAS